MKAKGKRKKNQRYIAARNALLCEAEQFADLHADRRGKDGLWSQFFMHRMTVLAVRARAVHENNLLLVPDGPWMAS